MHIQIIDKERAVRSINQENMYLNSELETLKREVAKLPKNYKDGHYQSDSNTNEYLKNKLKDLKYANQPDYLTDSVNSRNLHAKLK